ncbi:hypothetical protein B0H13DRAFT_2115301 [Mycena leptocephala]|nr:hypothetical protein B0H13DRAFT_2115301 [Mycena leptocephala]
MPVSTSPSLRSMRSENEDETSALLPSWPALHVFLVCPARIFVRTLRLIPGSPPICAGNTHPQPICVDAFVEWIRVSFATAHAPHAVLRVAYANPQPGGSSLASHIPVNPSLVRGGLINPPARVHSPFPMVCAEGDDPRGEGAAPGCGGVR